MANIKQLKLLFVFPLFLLISNCATAPQYNVSINSIRNPAEITQTKYLLLPGLKDVDTNDLQYQEYARYVETALVSKGYVKASNFNEAEIAIFLSYGIGDPETNHYTYSLPMYGQTGVASSHTYGTINTNRNTATYSGTTTYTPSYGITGYSTHTGSVTTYFRYMLLDAIDLEEYRRTEKEKQLWKTTVTSVGVSGDLRQVFPILVAASKDYIGTNTGKQIDIQIQESDKRVVDIKGEPIE